MVNNKYLFLKQNRGLIYGFGILSTLALTVGNVYFISQNLLFLPYALFVAFTFLYLALGYIVGLRSGEFNIQAHEIIRDSNRHLKNCDVDVFLPVCGEPLAVLNDTWEGVRKMLGFKHVYVLDDGKSKEVELLAKEFGFTYMTRPTNELKKAGNLRHAFSKTSSPFILILDADFIPKFDFLEETLPRFGNPNVAIVQTPQFFPHKDSGTWIQNAAGAIQELFYRLIQVNRDYFNGAICVGTNAVYRRSALEPFGGTAPIAYSEDVHTGFQLISSGWKIKYLPLILAQGLCPEHIKQYFTQQYRWSMGSISLFFSKKFWTAKITTMQRICYLTGMFYYMTTGLGILFAGLPSLIMLGFYPEKIMWFNLLFSVPSFLFSTVFMYIWMKQGMTLDVLRARYVSYFAHLFALKDYLFGTLEEWKPTGAKFKSNRFETFKSVFAAHVFITSVVPLLLVFFRIIQGYDWKNFILCWFFLVFNLALSKKIFKSFGDGYE